MRPLIPVFQGPRVVHPARPTTTRARANMSRRRRDAQLWNGLCAGHEAGRGRGETRGVALDLVESREPLLIRDHMRRPPRRGPLSAARTVHTVTRGVSHTSHSPSRIRVHDLQQTNKVQGSRFKRIPFGVLRFGRFLFCCFAVRGSLRRVPVSIDPEDPRSSEMLTQ